MANTLLKLQFECDRAAREFLAIPAWGYQRSKVREAVNNLTSGSQQSRASLVWLLEQAAKLPTQDEPTQKLHELVQADAALRSHKSRPESARELEECNFPSRLRAC